MHTQARNYPRKHDIDVFVDITVSCPECGMHATVREFIENGGCRCETPL